MTKNKKCKVCGGYSGKRRVCAKCKKEQPYSASGQGGNPFERKALN